MIDLLLPLFFTHVIYSAHVPLLFNYITPHNCSNTTAYFDSLNFQCRNCNGDSIASFNHLYCICPSGTIQISDGTCQKCQQGKKVSSDGHFCIDCSMTKTETQCSLCPFRHFMQRTISSNGTIMTETCAKCPANNKVSTYGDTCIPCLKTDDNCECQDDETCKKVEENKMFVMIELENGSQESSTYIAKNIRRATKGCSNGNTQACQHLANICVLQNYRMQTASACTEFEKIANSMIYKRNNGLLTTPILFYHNSEASIELSRETAISASFSFNINHPNSFLEIILIQYALNGTFIGMKTLSESNLNICSQQKNKFHFGTFYQMQCFIQLQHLLHLSGGQPIFSDLFIAFLNKSGQKQMYAVPILNENIRLHGEFVNRLTPDEFSNSKWILTRRLYFVDSISLDTAQNSAIIRYPEKIDIRVQIQSRKNGQIMPAYVRIRHAEIQRNPEKQLLVEFAITYHTNESQFFLYIEIALFAFAVLSFIFAAIRAYSWGKRSGKMIIDGATLIKLILFECEILSDVFLFVILTPTLFTVFAYKMQQIPQYVIFNSKQEEILLTYILVTTVLKLITLLHCNAHLILTKTFFIDWERPHVTFKTNNKAPVSSDVREDVDIAQPVIWRTYLVANEWNELQDYRKTSVGLQMITMIALLNWLKLENWAAITPGLSTNIPVSTKSTTLSELAIISSIYLTVSVIQWIFRVTIVEQLFLDPFHNMIDLCSISNISILALTHPLHGYYIHGRSVHDQADTDMIRMNQYLHRERENLCGTRGLEAGSGLQTYIVNLPKAFREQFDAASQVLENDIEQLDKHTADHFDATTTNIQKIAKGHEQLNNFLIKFIEHNNPQADYIINDTSLPELLCDIEFTDSSHVGNFIRDKSEIAYSAAFIYGNEWVYLSFELSLFCSVYIFTRSYTCSAFITYIISVISRKLVSTFFTNHLIKSSFVDHRFLF
ncbi:MGC26979 protein, putative [Brugia malayi]|uniref:MGC26979 protein, putative n=1 Tax=Brugia malayi TaxID=6279 RepID=A0A4E9FEU5_BRUMA|nr:MGC26979 protein, putative [Brugia malayi]VIO94856.1 MGC26979 protein, putative [Brugia malayi]